MARDSSGTYTLPVGNPVNEGEVIESAWANTTLEDVRDALTDSLDRLGRGGMLAPFQFTDGLINAPGMTWANEPTSGLYRSGAGDMRVTILGTDRMRWTQTAVQVWGSSTWRNIVTFSTATSGQRLEYDGTNWNAYTPAANGKVGGGLPTGGTNGYQLSWNAATSTWDTIAPTTGTSITPGNATNDTLRWGGSGYVPNSNVQITAAGAITAASIAASVTGDVTGDVSGDLVKATTNTNNLNTSGNITVSGTVNGINLNSLSSTVTTHVGTANIHFADATGTVPKLRKSNAWVDGVESTAESPELPITGIRVVQTLPGSPDAQTLYVVTT
jgi:hypothetical protein